MIENLDLLSILIYGGLFFFTALPTIYFYLFRKFNAYYFKFGKFFVVILLLLAGCRANTGTDYQSYATIWSGIKPIYYFFSGDFGYASLEPGFLLVVSILRTFSHFLPLFFFTMSLLSILPIYYGIAKIDKRYLVLSFFIFFQVFYFPYVFNGIRQAISMAIFIYIIKDIIELNWKRVFVFALISASFHSSGIAIILAYFIFKFNFSYIKFILFGAMITVLLRLLISVNTVINILGISSYYIDGVEKESTFFQLFTRLLIGLMFLFYRHYYLKKSLNTTIFSNLLNVYFLGLFIYIYFFELNIIATRINMFFRILEILLFPILFISINKFIDRLVLFFVMTIVTFFIFYVNLSNVDNNYHFFFF